MPAIYETAVYQPDSAGSESSMARTVLNLRAVEDSDPATRMKYLAHSNPVELGGVVVEEFLLERDRAVFHDLAEGVHPL